MWFLGEASPKRQGRLLRTMGLKQDVHKWQASFVFMTSVLGRLAAPTQNNCDRLRRRNLKPNDVQLFVHEYKQAKQNKLQNMVKMEGAFKSSEEASSI